MRCRRDKVPVPRQSIPTPTPDVAERRPPAAARGSQQAGSDGGRGGSSIHITDDMMTDTWAIREEATYVWLAATDFSSYRRGGDFGARATGNARPCSACRCR